MRLSPEHWHLYSRKNWPDSVITVRRERRQPQPADFDGDNKADVAVFRQTDGNWYV